MAQFDLFKLKSGVLVVDLQTDLIGIDVSRIVAPLREQGGYTAFPGLTPKVEFGDRTWIVRVQELASVTGKELGDRVGTLEHARNELKRVLDILIDGF
jgi:toxin CcdB